MRVSLSLSSSVSGLLHELQSTYLGAGAGEPGGHGGMRAGSGGAPGAGRPGPQGAEQGGRLQRSGGAEQEHEELRGERSVHSMGRSAQRCRAGAHSLM